MVKVRLLVITALIAVAVIYGFGLVTGTSSEDLDSYELIVEFKPTVRQSEVIIELAVGVAVEEVIARTKKSPYKETITGPRGIRMTLYATQDVSGELIVAIVNKRTGAQGIGRKTTIGRVGCTV